MHTASLSVVGLHVDGGIARPTQSWIPALLFAGGWRMKTMSVPLVDCGEAGGGGTCSDCATAALSPPWDACSSGDIYVERKGTFWKRRRKRKRRRSRVFVILTETILQFSFKIAKFLKSFWRETGKDSDFVPVRLWLFSNNLGFC